MKKQMTQSMIATVAAAVLLAGCGQGANVAGLANASSAGVNASATKTLLASFKHIYNAAFAKFDANGDKAIDEYEWGPIDLRDFTRADKNRNGKLTRAEFMAYADGGGFFRQDKNKFMKDTRDALNKAFNKLDANRDRMLSKEEMNNKALKKLGIYLAIPGLNMKVVIDEFDAELFASSDKTGDKLLSQAEFEDMYLEMVIASLGGEGAPAAASDEPVEPAN